MKGRLNAASPGGQDGSSHKYQPVSSDESSFAHNSGEDLYAEPDRDRVPRLRRGNSPTVLLENNLRKFRHTNKPQLIFIVMGVAFVTAVLVWVVALATHSSSASSCDTYNEGYTCSPEISRFWGQYSPYFSVPSDISSEVPDQCKITFVQILSRHGARDPTSGKSTKYNDTITKIHANTTSYTESFRFIQDYKYVLEADQLSPFGQQELVNSGRKFYERYQDLAKDITPFFRASGQDRVVESAMNWTQGFHAARIASNNEDANYPYSILQISEETGQNNTLDHGLCTAFEEGIDVGDEAQQTWLSVFVPPILKRLNDNLAGANLDSDEVIYLMDLCPFETVHSLTGDVSPFCALFSEREWQEYDYYQTLGKYYGYGPGNPFGPTIGVGFTNELIARLTETPVEDRTSTNATLDDSPDTFPLKATLYADFSHDNDMTAIFSTLGLYNATAPPLKDRLQDVGELKGYSSSWTVPFAARAYFEKMSCVGEAEEMVRVVVNDRVVPLETCGGDELGRCGLSAFVENLGFARAGGNWDQCFK